MMEGLGENDFIQYWIAFQLALDGVDIHDPLATQRLQCAYGHHCDVVFVTVTPPWILAMLSPLLWLPFHAAATAWLLCQFALALAVGIGVGRAHRDREGAWLYALLGTLLSFGLFRTLVLGQIGGLLLAGAALVYHSRTVRRCPWREGLGFFLLTVKPHLWVILGVAVLLSDLRQGRPAVLLWTIAWLATAAVLVQWLLPGATLAWLFHVVQIEPLPGVIPSADWFNGSAAFALRWWPGDPRTVDWRPFWLSVLPLALALALLPVVVFRTAAFDWRRHVLTMMAVSVLAAPFSWPSDMAVLALLSADALAGERTRTRLALVAAIMIFQAVAVWAFVQSEAYDTFLYWYGLGYLALIPWTGRRRA